MAEGSGAGTSEEERLLTISCSGEDRLVMMSRLSGDQDGRRSGSDGEAMANAESNVARHVMCFGSLPVVWDVDAGCDEDAIEIRTERDPVGKGLDQGRRKHRQVEKWKDGSSERSLGKRYHANEVTEEEASRRRWERRDGPNEATGSQVTVEEMATAEAFPNVPTARIDRSRSLGDGSAVNVEPGDVCEALSSAKEGGLNCISVQDANVFPGGEVHCEALNNGRGENGFVDIDSVGSGVADVDWRQSGKSADDESTNAVNLMEKIPQPQPPMPLSVADRTLRLSWVRSATRVLYELDIAGNELTASKEAPNSAWGGDHEWTSVSCNEELSYEVRNLKPGTPYWFRLRIIPLAMPPLAAPEPPPPSEVVRFYTLSAVSSEPSAPILVSRARTALKVKWTAPLESGGLPLEYVVEVNPPPGKGDANVAPPTTSDGFAQIHCGKEMSAKVNRLLPGTFYRFRVLATNRRGPSQFSEEAKYMTDASVPAAPEPPTLLSASATSMSVEWQEPNNAGSPITDYTLEHADGESGPFTGDYRGERRQYTLEGLKSGHMYRVRVMAHNRIGKGLFSKSALLYTNFTASSPPSTLSVTGSTTTSIFVTWGPPECDGGSAITAFEVEKLTSKSGWILIYYGDDYTYKVTGLSAGKEIGVRVRAVNLMGKSGWSPEGRFRTLPGPPEAPSAPEALATGSSSILVGWCPPAHDGGSSISAHSLEMCDARAPAAGKFVTVYKGGQFKFEVKRLDPGVTYTFVVRAYNEHGGGIHSEISPLQTLPAPPATPEPPVVVGETSASSISLRWTSPQNNGAPIQSYLLEMLVPEHGKTYSSGCDENTFASGNDLQGGNYVGLAGQRGHSDFSSPFSDGLPHSPSHSTSSESSRGTSAWDSEKSSQKNRTSPSYAGTSEDEHDVHGVSYETGVDGPVSSSHSLDLRLFVDGGRSNVAFREVYSGPKTACNVTKLLPCTSYAFRLQAKNSAGSSGFSVFSTVMTAPAAPAAPCPPIVVETTSSSLTLRWEAPEQDNGAPASRFTLEVLNVRSNRGSSNGQKMSTKKSAKRKKSRQDVASVTETTVWDPVFDGNALRHVVSGLFAGQKYSFRVLAHNAFGTSPPSSNADVSTLASAPGAPPPPTFSKMTPTSVLVKLSSPARDNGMPVTSYKLLIDDGQGGRLRKVYEGGSKSYRAVKLQPGSSYRVAAQAINSLGAGVLSEVAVIELPAAPPAAPPTPKVDISSEERRAPTMRDKPAKSLRESLTEMVHYLRQISREVQQPWSLQTRRWITGFGVSVTLIAVIVTLS